VFGFRSFYCEQPVSQIAQKLFAGFGCEEVVKNKSFKSAARPALSPSFLERTVAAQGPEKRH
jgi:hypothetical protein